MQDAKASKDERIAELEDAALKLRGVLDDELWRGYFWSRKYNALQKQVREWQKCGIDSICYLYTENGSEACKKLIMLSSEIDEWFELKDASNPKDCAASKASTESGDTCRRNRAGRR